MTGLEFLLLAFLIAAIVYIIWLEQQPKTDAEREAENFRRERLTRIADAQREKIERRKRDRES